MATRECPQEGTTYSEGTDMPISQQEAIVDAIASELRGGYVPTPGEIAIRYNMIKDTKVIVTNVTAADLLARAKAKAGK